MLAITNYSDRARRPAVATLRTLIWIEAPHFQGWGCSECAWVFNPSGPPVGNSFQEMKENYLLRRDEESATHVCAEHPIVKKARLQLIPQQTRRPIVTSQVDDRRERRRDSAAL
jgi:hypothetical protein